MAHIHVSALSAIVTFLQVIVVAFFWRWLSMRFHDNAIGKAMAFIY